LLQLCGNNNLVIANRTDTELSHPGHFMSHQSTANSVIDYLIISLGLYISTPSHSLKIEETDWSDHPVLHIKMNVPQNPTQAFVLNPRESIPVELAHNTTCKPETDLDKALAKILSQKRTPEELTGNLYGTASPSYNTTRIYCIFCYACWPSKHESFMCSILGTKQPK
jgi:hypothetical protein